MMANDWQRLNIWLKLNNRFDYAEYSSACATESVEPHGALEFAQKAGMVSAGICAHPEMSESEAYLKFISDNQQVYVPPPIPQQQIVGASTAVSAKPCCGGGKVL